MIYKPAEDSFRKGVEVLQVCGRNKEAMALFEASLLLDSRAQKTSGQPRYRSYYGLCLSTTKGKMKEALKLCRKACEDEFYNWEVWFNLGRVEREAGNCVKAHKALVRALRLQPRNQEIRKELEELGMRRPPMISFLGRDHPLNRFLGRLTYRTPSNGTS
jgi:Flp pilus assembly protein TadD